ncbi:MAG: UvrD-helicase domain-containing protein [Propionibacteriaceae bacterium]|jgi:exodeoxyribonuclease V beta subunit|nr:UvrD-helicase domain-containing protein [Propionibacteriaceae bacterium]
MRPFDPTGPLPGPGDFLSLEASAGTGKTWAVATLAARHLVEAGHRIDQIMVITFSDASTTELRDRVHDRLSVLAAALADPTTASPGATAGGAAADPVVRLICQVDDATRQLRWSRAEAALRDFDRAAIFTTHGFCDRMLSGLGVLVDHDPADRMAPEVDDLTRQTAGDLYLSRYASAPPDFSFPTALGWAHQAVFAPSIELAPDPAAPAGPLFVESLRQELERRKRLGGLYTFDDMLLRLRQALGDPVTGPTAASRLAQLYPVVLVDEFQDTDPVQWEILRSAFVQRSAVVVIGDPKQSIYGFRGADVKTYLAATATAEQATLDTNRRSAPAIVEAVCDLMSGLALGDDRIRVRPVKTNPATPRLAGVAGTAWEPPLRLRVPPSGRPSPVGQARQSIDADLVGDLTALLNSDLRLESPSGPSRTSRPLQPSDVAIIVSTNLRGRELLDRLTAAGLPAVFSGAQSVFAGPTAFDWLAWLEAVQQPTTARLRAASLTSLVGWSLDDLVAADSDRLAELAATVRQAGRVLTNGGPAAMLEWLADQTGLMAGLADSSDGPRRWTDLRHLTDLLGRAQKDRRLDLAGLTAWLRHQIERSSRRGDEAIRRLDRDAQAVRMLTVHQAKGLQWPVVYLPQASDRYPRRIDDNEAFLYHETDGRRRIDLGRTGDPERSQHLARHQDDEAGESLRMLYVGLTRAACLATCWWVPTPRNSEASALHRVLFGRRPDGSVADRADLPPAPLDWAGLDLPGLTVQPMADTAAPPSEPVPARPGPLRRPFDRAVDQVWRRTSYSALTAGLEHAPIEAESDESDLDWADRPPFEAALDDRPDHRLDQASPLADLPGGVGFGSLVHAVFEHADPARPEQWRQLVVDGLAGSELIGLDPDRLVEALGPGLATPLGPIADGLSLAQLPLSDRLAELDFELPLALGRPRACLGGLADLLDRHLPEGDPLADYAGRLRQAGLDQVELQGYLTGSIDAVLRLGQPQRHLVVDYKTNRLAPPDQPLRLRHYTPDRLAEAMMASHYPLQALLYEVALHRFLRWRQRGYDPAVHLGGIAYLFVRGMAGPDTPTVDGTPCGVFAWRPPVALVEGLDRLLAGESA